MLLFPVNCFDLGVFRTKKGQKCRLSTHNHTSCRFNLKWTSVCLQRRVSSHLYFYFYCIFITMPFNPNKSSAQGQETSQFIISENLWLLQMFHTSASFFEVQVLQGWWFILLASYFWKLKNLTVNSRPQQGGLKLQLCTANVHSPLTEHEFLIKSKVTSSYKEK